ncbi:cysteine-rich venom protein TEL1-like [Microcaecilia unicolor]|uniref:Cysteine-rich venom protein TEL1-like n=1 Tax=Microcaecilia unicolor TaxID=1415580 RepID=A0A6P7XK36_9AMPH|nr:cysteine-rich venom protein TEL1-like [Microcaecilia unicolor]
MLEQIQEFILFQKSTGLSQKNILKNLSKEKKREKIGWQFLQIAGSSNSIQMAMLIFTVCFAAMLHQTAGQDASPFSSLSTSLTENQNAVVDEHNSLRRQVSPTASNMRKMRWNATIAANAQRWADTCAEAHSQRSDRQINGLICGENLYMSSTPNSWSMATQVWYAEDKDFVYGEGPKTEGAVTGHYTQVVWDHSYELGCAIAYCPDATYQGFYVCQYFEAGNYLNRINTPYKEGIPCGDCPDDCDYGLCTTATLA